MYMMRIFQTSPSTGRARKDQTTRGFALIEALIAILILSLGLIGMTRLQTRSLQNNGGAYMRTQASLFASEVISRTQLLASSLNGGALPTTVPDCDSGASGSLAEQLSRSLPDASITCRITNRWLTISVEWGDSRWKAADPSTTFHSRMKL